MLIQVFAVDGTNTWVYSWTLEKGVYLEANTYSMPYCAAGDSTGLLAHPTDAFIYVRGFVRLVQPRGIQHIYRLAPNGGQTSHVPAVLIDHSIARRLPRNILDIR